MPFSPLIFGFSTTKTMVLLWSWHFTLHYFSFLLLIFLLLFLTNKVLSLFQESSILSFSTVINFMGSVGWSIIFIRHTILLPWNTIDFLPEKQFSIFNQLYYNYHTFSPVYILYLYQSKTPKWKVLSLFVLAALSCSSAKVTESADNSDPTRLWIPLLLMS
jgi:hypothetical protein